MFIGVTLVIKIIELSGVQFYNESSVYCIVCSPPKVKYPSDTIYPLLPSSTSPTPRLPLVTTVLWSVSMKFLFVCLICFFVAFCFTSHI